MKVLSKLMLALVFIGFVTACGDDSDGGPNQSLENAAIDFSAQNPPVNIPTALQTSTTEQAIEINSILSDVNSITTYSLYFNPPSYAEKSTTPINIGNTGGRIAGTQENVVVYTWVQSDGQGSATIAYQVSENDVNYMFDVFVQYDGQGFIHLLSGAESKADRREGYMEIFPDPVEGYTARLEWNEHADGGITFNYLYFDFYRTTVTVAPDGSGTIDHYENDILIVNYTWNAAGTAGTYTFYDSQGNGTTTEWTA